MSGLDTMPVDPRTTRDIAPEVLDERGRLRIMPAAYWEAVTLEERVLFCHQNGIYSLPTLELVERLRKIIGDRSAIEIGAGNGVLAEALEIPATDSFQQIQPKYKAIYSPLIPPVPYGPNVIEMHASRAVRHFKPAVVLGCWVTHKYERDRHEAGGNEVGIDEEDILRNCESYVVVGNEKVHAGKKIWSRRHVVEYPDFVYSRAHNGTKEFIAQWPGLKGQATQMVRRRRRK